MKNFISLWGPTNTGKNLPSKKTTFFFSVRLIPPGKGISTKVVSNPTWRRDF